MYYGTWLELQGGDEAVERVGPAAGRAGGAAAIARSWWCTRGIEPPARAVNIWSARRVTRLATGRSWGLRSEGQVRLLCNVTIHTNCI